MLHTPISFTAYTADKDLWTVYGAEKLQDAIRQDYTLDYVVDRSPVATTCIYLSVSSPELVDSCLSGYNYYLVTDINGDNLLILPTGVSMSPQQARDNLSKLLHCTPLVCRTYDAGHIFEASTTAQVTHSDGACIISLLSRCESEDDSNYDDLESTITNISTQPVYVTVVDTDIIEDDNGDLVTSNPPATTSKVNDTDNSLTISTDDNVSEIIDSCDSLIISTPVRSIAGSIDKCITYSTLPTEQVDNIPDDIINIDTQVHDTTYCTKNDNIKNSTLMTSSEAYDLCGNMATVLFRTKHAAMATIYRQEMSLVLRLIGKGLSDTEINDNITAYAGKCTLFRNSPDIDYIVKTITAARLHYSNTVASDYDAQYQSVYDAVTAHRWHPCKLQSSMMAIIEISRDVRRWSSLNISTRKLAEYANISDTTALKHLHILCTKGYLTRDHLSSSLGVCSKYSINCDIFSNLLHVSNNDTCARNEKTSIKDISTPLGDVNTYDVDSVNGVLKLAKIPSFDADIWITLGIQSRKIIVTLSDNLNGLTARTLSNITGVPLSTIYRLLPKLVQYHVISKIGRVYHFRRCTDFEKLSQSFASYGRNQRRRDAHRAERGTIVCNGEIINSSTPARCHRWSPQNSNTDTHTVDQQSGYINVDIDAPDTQPVTWLPMLVPVTTVRQYAGV